MNKRLIVIITAFIGVLILKDLPYFNVFISNRAYFIYLAICVISVFLFIRITIRFLVILTLLFLTMLLISTLFFEGLYSETFGVIVYFLLFSIAIGKTVSLIVSRKS